MSISISGVLERARKAAGISGMKRNYPDDPKQRGCGFWAAYYGSIRNDLDRIADEKLADQRTIATQAERIAELEAEKSDGKDRIVSNGVDALRSDLDLTPDQHRIACQRLMTSS